MILSWQFAMEGQYICPKQRQLQWYERTMRYLSYANVVVGSDVRHHVPMHALCPLVAPPVEWMRRYNAIPAWALPPCLAAWLPPVPNAAAWPTLCERPEQTEMYDALCGIVPPS